MKAVFYGYRADIVGLFWLAVAFFFSLALGSYYPLDPSFNAIGTVLAQAQNKCGYLGSFMADLLYQGFGLSSWVFVLLALRQSMLVFQRKWTEMEWMNNLIILFLSLFVCSSLLELHQPGRRFFEGHILPGGALGRAVVKISEPFLHFPGQVLVLWSLALALFVLITKVPVSDLVLKTGVLLKKGAVKTFLLFSSHVYKIFVKALGLFISFSSASLVFLRKKTGFKFPFLSSTTTTSSSLPSFPADSSLKKSDGKGVLFSSVSSAENYFFQEEKSAEEEGVGTEEMEAGEYKDPAQIKWTLPTADLLNPVISSWQMSARESRADAERLKEKLKQFSISGEITNIRTGPVITLFEFKPEDHVKVARITQMEDDLMIALKSKSIRIIAPIPGRDVVGIETAHTKRQMVYLKSLVNEPIFLEKNCDLPLVLGRHVDGRSAILDLGKIPHLMVAGSTGSGKSVFIVSFLLSLLFRHTPQSLRLLLVDPKRVDLSVFSGLPHLLAPPAREAKSAVEVLEWCLREMYKRYRSLSRFQARDLRGFNERIKHLSAEEIQQNEEFSESLEKTEEDYYFLPQPYICVVLEEFGDLMASLERSRVESLVVRLAQMARACGIHLILSMQSPRKDVVTGLIKTNIPGRISFKVSSRIDSRIILDEGGAERLLSQGDMLYLGPGQARPERYHGPFVSEKEVSSVVQFWKRQSPGNNFYVVKFSSEEKRFRTRESMSLDPEEDQKYEEVFSYVSELKEVSASHLQRRYGLGYPRAARLIDRLEEKGVVGPARGSKPREVLGHK